jgi:putative ABC transport system ATP-binding protein
MLSLKIRSLVVSFKGLSSPALAIADLTIASGSSVAVTGASGSGKSTFVNLITGLERPAAGRIFWGDTEIGGLSEGGRDRWRGENIGLIMQDFHLFAGLSALDNIVLPARLARAMSPERATRAHALLERVGLSRPDQRVETMSRGEMQRVAVARALLRAPGIIVADEPTASLDAASGAVVGNLLLELAAAEGSTLIVISHDARLADRLERRIVLDAGALVSDSAAEARA